MVLEIYEYLLAAYGAQLAVPTTKGFPLWARPDAVVPCVALEIGPTQPTLGRVGQQTTHVAAGYRGWVFARNEPELGRLLDALWSWHATAGSAFDIAAQRVACKLQETQRWEPLSSAEKEAHAQVFIVATAYSVG